MAERLLETYTPEELNRALDKYKENLVGIVDDEGLTEEEYLEAFTDAVLEEFLADAYAGINAFGAHAERYQGDVESAMDELYMGKARNQDNGTRQTNGPNKYSYGGENSGIANIQTLANAKELFAQGVDEETIRQETGWFKSYDGGWRFEVNDSEMKVLKNLTSPMFYGVPYTVTFNIRDKGAEQYQYLIDFKENKTPGLSNTAVKNLLPADQVSYEDTIAPIDENVKAEEWVSWENFSPAEMVQAQVEGRYDNETRMVRVPKKAETTDSQKAKSQAVEKTSEGKSKFSADDLSAMEEELEMRQSQNFQDRLMEDGGSAAWVANQKRIEVLRQQLKRDPEGAACAHLYAPGRTLENVENFMEILLTFPKKCV